MAKLDKTSIKQYYKLLSRKKYFRVGIDTIIVETFKFNKYESKIFFFVEDKDNTLDTTNFWECNFNFYTHKNPSIITD